jgi:PrtD family type I secretion system ABC transporter
LRNRDLAEAGAAVRGYFVSAGVFSLAINLLFLAGPLYMLQVYDRVVSSGSLSTLLMLTLVLLGAYVALTLLDVVRARILNRAGLRLDTMLADRILAATLSRPQQDGTHSQSVRDFDAVRQFVTGNGLLSLFDLPWAPIYLLVIALLHPMLGLFALIGLVVLAMLALVNEWLVRSALGEANEAARRSYSFADMSVRNTDVIRAMGLVGGLLRRWSRDRNLLLARQLTASDRAATMTSLIKFVRMALQSLVLGLGAYLVIERSLTMGGMFAASILLGRALQPMEQVVGGWRGFVSARDAFHRLRHLLELIPAQGPSLTLPTPVGRLNARMAVYTPPGSSKPILKGVTFFISAGETLGIVGPSGAGKSTLARLLVGISAPTSGVVRLDGADISIWPREQVGRHIGFLPQDVELFADSVAANIGRFSGGNDDAIVEAAKLAGVHELILELPEGYDTQVGDGGAVLSGGYRQRIGLARAVFGRPKYVVLDEPSSNLDAAGDFALAECIAKLKEQGTTVVIVSHRITTITAVDKLLVLRDGQVEAFGERQEIVAKFAPPTPLRAVPSASAAGER